MMLVASKQYHFLVWVLKPMKESTLIAKGNTPKDARLQKKWGSGLIGPENCKFSSFESEEVVRNLCVDRSSGIRHIMEATADLQRSYPTTIY